MPRRGVIVIGFLQALGRHVILPAIESVIVAFASEKGRQWAEKSFSHKDTPATTPTEEVYTDEMKKLVRSADGDPEKLIDGVTKMLNDHLNQPGSVFYMSTEFQVSELVDHFGRFTNPDDIDKFIRGEERPKVLEMAERRKEELAT